MTILLLLAMAAGGLAFIWAGQSVALKAVGEPLAWPLRFKTHDPRVKLTSRVMIHSTWVLIILLAPFALGLTPAECFRERFPTPVPWGDIGAAAAIMLVPVWLLYAFWLAAGWVRLQPKHDTATRRRKLVKRFLLPWPLATLEEAVFRGVVLQGFLQSLPQGRAGEALAVVLTAAVFSSIHFVKPPDGSRPAWQPAWGLFLVGCLFGLAYVLGGRTLWLPIAVHGAAVLGIETMRLYLVHQGPPWLVGYAEFPQSGLLGGLLVAGVGVALVLVFGM